MNTPKPIDINPSVAATALPVLLRQILLVVGGFVAIVGFIGNRDMASLYAYLQSEDFITFVGTAAMLGSFAYGQWRSLQNTADLTTIGREVPDSVAVVREPTPPPAVDEAL